MALVRPAPGNYVIYNRVLSPTGKKLAMTFAGQNEPLTVTPKVEGSISQVFKLADYDANLMSVVPQVSSNLEIGWGISGATPMTPGGYVWTINKTDEGYTLQDGGRTANWHLDKAVNNANVAIAPDQGIERYRWVFETVNL